MRDGIAVQRRQPLNDIQRPLIGRAALSSTSTLARFRSTATGHGLAAHFCYFSNQSPEGEVERACLDRLVHLTRARAGSYDASHHKSLPIENGNVARPRRLRKDIGRHSVGRRPVGEEGRRVVLRLQEDSRTLLNERQRSRRRTVPNGARGEGVGMGSPAFFWRYRGGLGGMSARLFGQSPKSRRYRRRVVVGVISPAEERRHPRCASGCVPSESDPRPLCRPSTRRVSQRHVPNFLGVCTDGTV